MLHDAIGPNGVEAPISVWERVCRANTEGRIRRYAPRIGFFDHCSARVDTHDVTKRSDDLGDRAHVVAGPAAHVEHVHPSVKLLYRKGPQFVVSRKARAEIEIFDQTSGVRFVDVAKIHAYFSCVRT